jgi:hypothetical protein
LSSLRKYHSFSRLWLLSLFVIITHGLGIYIFNGHYNSNDQKKVIARSISVQTIALKPEKPKSIVNKRSPLNEKKKSPPKKKKEKKTVKKEKVSSSKEKKKSSEKKPEKEFLSLVEDLQNHLKNAQTKEDLSLSSKRLSVPHLKLSIEKLSPEKNDEDSRYATLLVTTLQAFLLLPEHGQVSLRLTLDRKGILVDWEITQCPSTENKKYLRQMLPTLSFPSLDGAYEGKSTVIFPLRLQS